MNKITESSSNYNDLEKKSTKQENRFSNFQELLNETKNNDFSIEKSDRCL